MQLKIDVPDLTLENTIGFVSKLYNLPDASKYVFDFKSAKHFDPIALLYLSSEIERCRERKRESDFSVQNYKSCAYAAHMGFFQAFGADYGNFPGGEIGNTTYIPICILSSESIKTNAAERMKPIGEYIEGFTKEMTNILIQDTSTNTYGVLAYSLREVLRNVIEHSETEKFAFCAQYWPSKHKASVAILDRGIGIKASLSLNPFLTLKDDAEALRQALLPGISGKMFKGKRKDPYDHWQNSGYGLYMTSEISKMGGSFFIASGSAALLLEAEKLQEIDIFIKGTLLNITIDTSQINKVEDMLMNFSLNLKHKKGYIKPSGASTTFSKDTK